MNAVRFFSAAVRTALTSELAQLRRKTGFTLANCRKALNECQNDVAKAEEWLMTEAKRLGWEAAAKLQGRVAREGLVAIARTERKAVLVEVNCETDFVARNEKFVSLVQLVASTCLAHHTPETEQNLKKTLLSEEIGDFRTAEQGRLQDIVAQRTGELGEKIFLRRAVCYQADDEVSLAATVHPPVLGPQNVLTGKYAAMVVLKRSCKADTGDSNLIRDLGISLCKHVIGMSPKTIGTYDESAAVETLDEESAKLEMESVDDESESDTELAPASGDKQELVNQSFLSNPDVIVGELLKDHQLTVVDFVRFECGEDDKGKSVSTDGKGQQE